MSAFKVGEVAIGQHFDTYPELNGADLVVTEPLAVREWHVARSDAWQSGLSYVVRTPDGVEGCVKPHNLRKKRPPTTGEERVLAMFRHDQRQGVAA